MEWLPCLKTSINMYFRTHHNDLRKLTNHEWAVTNEICSVLDPIADVTTKIQGSNGTRIGQAMSEYLRCSVCDSMQTKLEFM